MNTKTYLLSVIFIVLMGFSTFAAEPLVLSYAGGTGSGSSTSNFVQNNWDYTYQYHVLTLTGDVPQGKVFSQIQLEQSDDITGLSYAKFSLYGSNYDVEFGDNTVNFSELTLSNFSYQGTGVTLQPWNALKVTVVGGARGKGLWGYDVLRDTRPQETFSGIKTSYDVGNGLGLSATYLSTQGGNDVADYGGTYNYGGFTFSSEYGKASEGEAVRSELKYQNNWLELGTIYRDIDSTYSTPTDYVNYTGMKGTYSSLGLKPMNNMNITVQSNSYLDSLNTSGEAMNLDTRGDLSYNFTPSTNIGYSGFRDDRNAYEGDGVTQGEIMYITQQFVLLTKNAIYYRYQPTWFDSSVSDESYSENENVAGINISLFDFTHLNYEIENGSKFFKDTDVTLKPTAITARMDVFETQILNSPYYLSSSVSYRRESADSTATDEAITTTTYSDLTLKYVPNSDLSCYITGKVTDIEGPDVDESTRHQVDLSFGLNYAFNTNFYMK